MFQQTRRILTMIVTFSILLHSGLLGAVKRAQAGSPDLWAHWTLAAFKSSTTKPFLTAVATSNVTSPVSTMRRRR